MVTTWPSLVDRVHVSTRLLGQVLLAVLLTVSLAFSWRDGVPTTRPSTVTVSGRST